MYSILFFLLGWSANILSPHKSDVDNICRHNYPLQIDSVQFRLAVKTCCMGTFSNIPNTDLMVSIDEEGGIHVYDYNEIEERKVGIRENLDLDYKKYGNKNKLLVHSVDSIFIFQKNRIVIMDTAKVIGTIDIPILKHKGFALKQDDYFHSKPIYDSKAARLYFSVYPMNASYFSSRYYKAPIMAYYDMKTQIFHFLDITYPKKYVDNFYGFLMFFSTSFDGENILFSFTASDDVIKYNLRSNTVTSHTATSCYKRNDTPALHRKKSSTQDLKTHNELAGYYLSIIYDPYRSLYYRVYVEELAEKNEKGEYNDFSDKVYVIMVLDKNLQVIAERRIPKMFPYLTFVKNDGLYLPFHMTYNKMLNKFIKLQV